ncbi:unnamed protein product, partial [Tetraodon nigroviridis]
MRDRLSELQTSHLPVEELEAEEDQSDDAEERFIVFDGQEMMDGLHKEAQALRKEMQLLRADVRRLGKQNARFLTSVRRISSIKRDANALRRDIKERMDAIYARMETLKKQGKEQEEQPQSSAAVARMVQVQCVSLAAAFHEVVCEYNEAEMSQRENCLSRIQRQANIMGKELSTEEMEEMMETGKVNVFADNVLLEGKTARSALSEIESRHKELLELEKRIREIQELFSQMALLVEEQGFKLDNVQANVTATRDYVAKAEVHVRKAVRYQRRNPCRRLFCCCCL